MKKLFNFMLLAAFFTSLLLSPVFAVAQPEKGSKGKAPTVGKKTGKKAKVVKVTDVVGKPTPGPAPKKESKPSDLSWEFGLDFISFPSVSAGTLAPGFQYLNSSALEASMYIEPRLRNVALKLSLNLSSQSVGLDAYGSSFDAIRLSSPVALAVKYYVPSELWPVHPYVGFGGELTSLSGSYQMGGAKWQTTGNQSISPVIPLGFEFGDIIRCHLEYDIRMVDLVTSVPGVGSEEYKVNGNVAFGGAFYFQ